MNQSEMRFFLTEMQSIWRTVEVSDVSIGVWHRQFEDVDLNIAQKALDAYIRGASGDDYPPKPADILRMLVRAATSLPNEDEAWRMVVAEIRRVGACIYPHFIDGKEYRLRPGIPILEVAIAAESVGWMHLVNALGDPKEAGYAQLNFREAYRRAVARTNEVAAVMGIDHLNAWRADEATKLRAVHLEEPVTLYAMGAPVPPPPGVPGPYQPPAIEAESGLSDEQKAANRQRLADLFKSRGVIKTIDPPKPRSALAMKRGSE